MVWSVEAGLGLVGSGGVGSGKVGYGYLKGDIMGKTTKEEIEGLKTSLKRLAYIHMFTVLMLGGIIVWDGLFEYKHFNNIYQNEVNLGEAIQNLGEAIQLLSESDINLAEAIEYLAIGNTTIDIICETNEVPIQDNTLYIEEVDNQLSFSE